MIGVVINLGTGRRPNRSLDNATKVIDFIAIDLSLPRRCFRRAGTRDDAKGYFGFDLNIEGKTIEIDVPGDDPDVVHKGAPIESPRLYIDGSSWLYGFAMNAIRRRLDGEN